MLGYNTYKQWHTFTTGRGGVGETAFQSLVLGSSFNQSYEVQRKRTETLNWTELN